MADIEELKAAIDRKAAGARCPACGESSWVVPDRPAILQAGAPDGGGALDLGEGMEVVPVVCDRCGYIRLHAAVVLEE
ncbi:MAG: hypothetical protein M3Z33_08815 [Actinomycetota bacterium]|nr:hypothetical protein [Actinomycetota bacterium]